MLVSDLIYAAMRAARKHQLPGLQASTDGKSDCLTILNQILDEWSARKAYAFNHSFTAFTLTPNHAPHLIGPGLTSPDFAAALRPLRIESAAVILNTATPPTDRPLTIRDDAWWANQRLKTLTSTFPTDLYYSPDVPSGALYLWPVPTVAYGLRLQAQVTPAPFANVGATVTLPPAYARALTLTLAEEICMWWGLELPPQLPMKAAQARRTVQGNNISSPAIATTDAGANHGRGSGGFNYLTGGLG